MPRRRSSTSSPSTTDPWTPRYLFVYGSLMDPDWTQRILNRPEPPQMTDASITGYQIKMWGPYPTLLLAPATTTTTNTQPDDTLIVHGKAFILKTQDEQKRLERYETDAYRIVRCSIEIRGTSEKVVNGWTFIWSRPEDTDDLEEGRFDLEEWKRM